MRRTFRFLLTGIAFLASIPAAQAQIYKVTLNGASEIPVVTTPGTGSAIITLNPTTHEMRVRVTFGGLLGNTTASHVHCCAVQPTNNAGVATTTPTFPGTPLGVTAGSWERIYDMSQAGAWNPAFVNTNGGGTVAGAEAAFLAGVAAGQVYLNLHSTFAPGGEIRGVLVLNKFAANSAVYATGAAAALDSLGAGTGVLSDALVSLASMQGAEQAAAIDKLTPSTSRGTQVVVSESMTTAFDQISNRLDGLRLAGASAAVIPSALGTRREETANSYWVAGNGVSSRQGSRDGFAGYKNTGGAWTVGLDRRISSNGFFGGAVNRSFSSLIYRHQSDGDDADITSTQLSFYGAQNLGRVFIEGMGAYGWQQYENTRNTGLTGAAAGDFDGHAWGFRFGGGVPIGMGSHASLTPQARLDWGSVSQEAYTETGGGPLALSVESRSADTWRSSIGMEIDFASHVGDFKARPFVRGFWHHNFSDDGLDSTATFVSGGASFITPGQKLDSNPYSVGAGINFFTEGAFTAAVVYDGIWANSYQSHVYQAKLRWAF